MTPCHAPGCDHPADRPRVGLCEGHYSRQRRTGSLGNRPVRKRGTPPPACLNACGRPALAAGRCHGCAAYYRANGTDERRGLPTGAAHPHWSEVPTYSGLHQRLRKARGQAREQVCIDCGQQAGHWSLDGPASHAQDGYPYSLDLSAYVPRCVPCHKRHDLTA